MVPASWQPRRYINIKGHNFSVFASRFAGAARTIVNGKYTGLAVEVTCTCPSGVSETASSNYKSSGDNGLTASGKKVSFAVSAIRDRTQKDSGKAGITPTVQSEIDRGRVNKMIHTQRGVI